MGCCFQTQEVQVLLLSGVCKQGLHGHFYITAEHSVNGKNKREMAILSPIFCVLATVRRSRCNQLQLRCQFLSEIGRLPLESTARGKG